MLYVKYTHSLFCLKLRNIVCFPGSEEKRVSSTHYLDWKHYKVTVGLMPWQSEMSPHCFDCVCLRVVDGRTKVPRHPVCEAARLPLTTNTYIGWGQPRTCPRVLFAQYQVDSRTLACDVLCYLGCGSRDGTGICGGILTVQTKSAV